VLPTAGRDEAVDAGDAAGAADKVASGLEGREAWRAGYSGWACRPSDESSFADAAEDVACVAVVAVVEGRGGTAVEDGTLAWDKTDPQSLAAYSCWDASAAAAAADAEVMVIVVVVAVVDVVVFVDHPSGKQVDPLARACICGRYLEDGTFSNGFLTVQHESNHRISFKLSSVSNDKNELRVRWKR
jgi:hypothetical protein